MAIENNARPRAVNFGVRSDLTGEVGVQAHGLAGRAERVVARAYALCLAKTSVSKSKLVRALVG